MQFRLAHRQLGYLYPTWYVHKYKVHKLKKVLLVEYMDLVFTRTPGENYRRRLTAWLCLFDVLRALILRIPLYDIIRALIQKIPLYIHCQTLMAHLQRRCSTSVQ